MASARACSIPPSKLAIAAIRPFASEREVTAGMTAESKITIIPRTTSISTKVKARKRPRSAGTDAKAGADCFREQVFIAESARLDDSLEVISYTAGEDEQSNGGGDMGRAEEWPPIVAKLSHQIKCKNTKKADITVKSS